MKSTHRPMCTVADSYGSRQTATWFQAETCGFWHSGSEVHRLVPCRQAPGRQLWFQAESCPGGGGAPSNVTPAVRCTWYVPGGLHAGRVSSAAKFSTVGSILWDKSRQLQACGLRHSFPGRFHSHVVNFDKGIGLARKDVGNTL